MTINDYTNAGASYSAAKAGSPILKNPFQVPQQIVFRATAAAAGGVTQLYLDDAMGLAAQLALVGGANSQQFVVDEVTATVLKKWLQTYCIVVIGYNFECDDAAQLSKNLMAVYSAIDGNSMNKKLFSAQTVSNMQQNPNLLNVDQPFVWSFDCALKLAITAPTVDTVFVFTMKILGAVPYGNLETYLEQMQIPERSKMNRC